MNTYDSASWDFPITGTRKDAIEKAHKFLTQKVLDGTVIVGNRFTWRAADDSGFTLQVKMTPTGQLYIETVNKWNKSRNS